MTHAYDVDHVVDPQLDPLVVVSVRRTVARLFEHARGIVDAAELDLLLRNARAHLASRGGAAPPTDADAVLDLAIDDAFRDALEAETARGKPDAGEGGGTP